MYWKTEKRLLQSTACLGRVYLTSALAHMLHPSHRRNLRADLVARPTATPMNFLKCQMKTCVHVRCLLHGQPLLLAVAVPPLTHERYHEEEHYSLFVPLGVQKQPAEERHEEVRDRNRRHQRTILGLIEL